MTGGRAKKRPRIVAAAKEQPNYGQVNQNIRSDRGKVIQSRQPAEHRESTDVDYDMPADADIEATMPFCCAVCKCSAARKKQLSGGGEDNLYICPSRDSLCHRRCCHGVLEEDREWAPPIEAAFAATEGKIKERPGLEWVSAREIQNAYNTAKTQEAQLYNADGDAHPESIIRTHEDYEEGIVKPYEALVKELRDGEKTMRRCVVLDTFAGIGTGIVVLKRLGIAIKKVIHVEHDKVATHVYRRNHDREYNSDLPGDGGIEHVYIEKFATVTDSLEEFCEEHGPIDIVLGGPPCVDFSLVNANRQGVQGSQGQYMLKFGRMIRKIERLQRPNPLFFLAENVILKGDDLEETRDAFGLDFDPITVDAMYLSPTRRKRHFIMNIPLVLGDFDFQGSASEVGPSSCLEEGFKVPGHIIENNFAAKAQCFMASSSRIDERSSLRMYIFKDKDPNSGLYHGRPMNVSERELLMGYPKGYVENSVSYLFDEVVKALRVVYREDSECLPQAHWRKDLPEKLHHFAGNYHSLPGTNFYRIEVVKDEKNVPCECAKMAPPLSNRLSQPTFFNETNYSKHLIGLAYSVPVVELLLRPLQRIFASRYYADYEYTYPWVPKDE